MAQVTDIATVSAGRADIGTAVAEGRRVNVVLWVVNAAIIIGLVLPLVPLLIWSFSQNWFFPSLLPQAWSMRAWQYVTSETSQVPSALWITTLVGLVVTLLSVVIGLPAGRALGLNNFRGKTVIEFLILAPTIVPGLAVAMGIHVAFIKYGLADTMLGVILVHLVPTLPYVVLVLAGLFANYNPEYEQQARTLGAGPVRTFWHVTLPAIFPGLMAAALFAFLVSWSQYVLTVLIGGGAVITLPVLLFTFAGGGDNAITGALSIVYIAPAIFILILTSRSLTGENAALGGIGRK